MNNKRYISLFYSVCISLLAILAQGPNNSGTYYEAADGKKGENLKTALFNIIKNHTTLSYSSLEDYYHYTDERPDGCIRDWYSNITNYEWDKHGNSSEGAGWNKEHTVPQSWFNEASPMKSDIVHVVPTDAKINNMRSAYVIAEVGTVEKASANNYSLLGSCKTSGYSGKVFEPNDEIKGDMARIYFYMATCYQDKLKNWTKGEAQKVFTSSAYPGLQQWYLEMLFRWSKQDPVDEVEIARNNAVASDEVQGNPNPFVDYPGLEAYIWGTLKDEAFSYDNYAGGNNDGPDPNLTPNPNPDPDSDPDPDPVLATSCVIKLNNEFFGVSWNGAKTSGSESVLEGTSNGITVSYKLGSSANMYCNNEQIRIYAGNELVFSSNERDMVSIEFTTVDSNKKLLANTGKVEGYKWTGCTREVTFSSEANHIRMTEASVGIAEEETGIDEIRTMLLPQAWFTLSGQRVQAGKIRKGLYIYKGKKLYIR